MLGEQTNSNKKSFKPTRLELYDWLGSQTLCVIATRGLQGYPNSATVAFSQTKQFEFVIGTDTNSRKAANMRRDERVAMTITSEDERRTVQLQGKAEELTKEKFSEYEKYHYQKLPFSLPFKDIPSQVVFKITPVYLRFSDVSVHPWELTEYEI